MAAPVDFRDSFLDPQTAAHIAYNMILKSPTSPILYEAAAAAQMLEDSVGTGSFTRGSRLRVAYHSPKTAVLNPSTFSSINTIPPFADLTLEDHISIDTPINENAIYNPEGHAQLIENTLLSLASGIQDTSLKQLLKKQMFFRHRKTVPLISSTVSAYRMLAEGVIVLQSKHVNTSDVCIAKTPALGLVLLNDPTATNQAALGETQKPNSYVYEGRPAYMRAGGVNLLECPTDNIAVASGTVVSSNTDVAGAAGAAATAGSLTITVKSFTTGQTLAVYDRLHIMHTDGVERSYVVAKTVTLGAGNTQVELAFSLEENVALDAIIRTDTPSGVTSSIANIGSYYPHIIYHPSALGMKMCAPGVNVTAIDPLRSGVGMLSSTGIMVDNAFKNSIRLRIITDHAANNTMGSTRLVLDTLFGAAVLNPNAGVVYCQAIS